MNETIETIELTTEDKEMLQHIYNVRRKFFVQVCIGLLGIALYTSFRAFNYTLKYKTMPPTAGFILCFGLIEGLLFISMFILYKRRIVCLKQDVDNNIKEVLSYTITDKQYFEHTGQYFLCIDNLEHSFQEVDGDAWQQAAIGSAFPIYQAPLSKYVFNARGKYTII